MMSPEPDGGAVSAIVSSTGGDGDHEPDDTGAGRAPHELFDAPARSLRDRRPPDRLGAARVGDDLVAAAEKPRPCSSPSGRVRSCPASSLLSRRGHPCDNATPAPPARRGAGDVLGQRDGQRAAPVRPQRREAPAACAARTSPKRRPCRNGTCPAVSAVSWRNSVSDLLVERPSVEEARPETDRSRDAERSRISRGLVQGPRSARGGDERRDREVIAGGPCRAGFELLLHRRLGLGGAWPPVRISLVDPSLRTFADRRMMRAKPPRSPWRTPTETSSREIQRLGHRDGDGRLARRFQTVHRPPLSPLAAAFDPRKEAVVA